MATKSYNQYCAVARALDVVGERWTLLIVRELLMGPKRFGHLVENLPGIGTNLLTARLKGLEESGVIEHGRLPPPSGVAVYQLTPLGRELEPVIRSLYRWGSLTMDGPRPGDRFRSGWAMLAMQYAFRPHLAEGLRETYEYRIGDDVFHARIDHGTITMRQSPAEAPDLIIETDAETFEAIAMQRLTLKEAIADERVEVLGDPGLMERSAELFGLSND